MAKFFCKYCGKDESDPSRLLRDTCPKHPAGTYKGKHELFEGPEDSEYRCIYCGKSERDFRRLVTDTCSKHPNGTYKGNHSPLK